MSETRLILPKPVERRQKRMAAYCRVSSGSEQQMHSYNAQVDYYSGQLASRKDCVLVKVYADAGITGTVAEKRPQFMQMIEDCRAGAIDAIITKSVSRFGRNTVDTLSYIRELRRLGIDVFFEKENIHSIDPHGELILTLMAAFAEAELESMSESVKWGLHKAYSDGKVESLTLGKFYGYNKCGPEIEIVEKEAEVVRRMYREYLDGCSWSQIARHLTEDGIPTERGNEKWLASTVRKILGNEKYKGDALFVKTYVKDPLTHKRELNHGERTQYYCKDCLPVIVPPEQWELVQLERKRRQAYTETHGFSCYAHSSAENPLSTRITCGVCGRSCVILASKLRDSVGWTYWRCGSFRGKNGSPIEGETFTPHGQPLRNVELSHHVKNYRKLHRKLPQPRQKLCTDIVIDAGQPEKAFVRAWNLLVAHRQRYEASLTVKATSAKSPLDRYRALELIRLIGEVGTISEFDYDFSLKVLERIEVTPRGKLAVHFLAGLKITP